MPQARDDKGSAAAIQEEMKDVPPLAAMAAEIKDEVFDDEDDTLDAGARARGGCRFRLLFFVTSGRGGAESFCCRPAAK